MSQSSEYEIRYLTTDDLEQYNALLRYAFQITEQDVAAHNSCQKWRTTHVKAYLCI